MNTAREHTAEKIAVMQAFLDMESIQRTDLRISNAPWIVDTEPTWNWDFFCYRIAPRPRRVWVTWYKCGCCGVYMNRNSAEKNKFAGGEVIEFIEPLADEGAQGELNR